MLICVPNNYCTRCKPYLTLLSLIFVFLASIIVLKATFLPEIIIIKNIFFVQVKHVKTCSIFKGSLNFLGKLFITARIAKLSRIYHILTNMFKDLGLSLIVTKGK